MWPSAILMAALLVALAAPLAPAGAQQEGQMPASPHQQEVLPGQQGSGGSPSVPAATQGGMQGDCPAGQVMSAAGGCEPGQPGAAGGTASEQMPASPHQQELLRGQQGSEGSPN
jgi:hypothetical protein